MNYTEKVLHSYLAIASIAGSTDFENVIRHYEENSQEVNHVVCMVLRKAADCVNNNEKFDSLSYLLSLLN